jgi:hypothetical protein
LFAVSKVTAYIHPSNKMLFILKYEALFFKLPPEQPKQLNQKERNDCSNPLVIFVTGHSESNLPQLAMFLTCIGMIPGSYLG